jgi:hypothetical protein
MVWQGTAADKAEALQSAEKADPRVDLEWMRIRYERDLDVGWDPAQHLAVPTFTRISGGFSPRFCHRGCMPISASGYVRTWSIQRSAMPLSDHFGGYYACSLTAANISMKFPQFVLRAVTESCGSTEWSTRRGRP